KRDSQPIILLISAVSGRESPLTSVLSPQAGRGAALYAPFGLESWCRHRFRRAVYLGLNAESRFQRFVVWIIESWGDAPGLRLHSAFGAKQTQVGRGAIRYAILQCAG